MQNLPVIGSVATLDETEQMWCAGIAKRRFESNRKRNVTNARVGPQSDAATDLEGCGAELAFCKLFNLYPDFSIEPRTSKTDAGDCTLHDGRTVDVKGTPRPNGRLLAVPWKAGGVLLYALMTGPFPVYTYRGIMTAGDLLQEYRLGNLGRGPTYIAEQHELNNLADAPRFPL